MVTQGIFVDKTNNGISMSNVTHDLFMDKDVNTYPQTSHK